MKVLAIIPARGGSKGLTRKNIRLLSGHPLIAYSILAASQSRLVNRTIVSTDDEEIATVSRQYHAEVPFKRPAELAMDLSTDLEVFQHALCWLKDNEKYVPDYIVQLRPTSPVRHAGLIDFCIEKLIGHAEADSLRVVTEAPVTPYKMWRIEDENKSMKPLLKLDGVDEFYNMPRQQLPKVYWQIGTLDVIRTNTIVDMGTMSGQKIIPHIVPSYLALDIDDETSFNRAEHTLASNHDLIQFPVK